jgi:hypothetical protein
MLPARQSVHPRTPPARSPPRLASQIKSCKEQPYRTSDVLTLSCPKVPDLRERKGWQLRNLGRAIKSTLQAAPNCDFKPCGYKMDAGGDLTPIDHNSFAFPIQGRTVRRDASRAAAFALDYCAFL